MAAAKASKSMSKLHAVFLDGVARGARLNLKEWSRSMTLEELCQFIAGKPGAKYRQTTLLVHPDKFDAKRVPENEREFRTELFEVLSAKKKEQEQSGRHP
ncbi:J domain-containing protein [Plasmodiophora brassicae]